MDGAAKKNECEWAQLNFASHFICKEAAYIEVIKAKQPISHDNELNNDSFIMKNITNRISGIN